MIPADVDRQEMALVGPCPILYWESTPLVDLTAATPSKIVILQCTYETSITNLTWLDRACTICFRHIACDSASAFSKFSRCSSLLSNLAASSELYFSSFVLSFSYAVADSLFSIIEMFTLFLLGYMQVA